MEYKVTIRFYLDGEYENSEDYNVEIPNDTTEDDTMEALMDATRPILNDEFEGNEDWEDGNYTWELNDFTKL